MNGLQRRLSKVEKLRNRNDGEREVDIELERMGTSRAGLLADFGSLFEFRDWLDARMAAADHPAGVRPSIAAPHRKRPVDPAVSAKWDAILDRYEALQPADTSP
ncbi:hypothetical protein [Accumulibacter sp.]|jgi:hypothetical protein|uniref:hypothetical protein n=1 Tax=Accumulibacter sp. TaxID=2053492 RepID=UPI001AD10A7F|nr:hypothetical protein [Accumulibacter sp.]MBN8455723.1 hypothetical protein [Accumulibacter sp.]MBO3710186.1 hypothetical protein [Accumulibacter sp.]